MPGWQKVQDHQIFVQKSECFIVAASTVLTKSSRVAQLAE